MKVKEWYSAADIVKILRAAKAAGACELVLGGLSVKFSGIGYNELRHANVEENYKENDEKAQEAQETNEKAFYSESEMNLKEEILGQMLVSDPSQYEELMAQGDLDA